MAALNHYIFYLKTNKIVEMHLQTCLWRHKLRNRCGVTTRSNDVQTGLTSPVAIFSTKSCKNTTYSFVLIPDLNLLRFLTSASSKHGFFVARAIILLIGHID